MLRSDPWKSAPSCDVAKGDGRRLQGVCRFRSVPSARSRRQSLRPRLKLYGFLPRAVNIGLNKEQRPLQEIPLNGRERRKTPEVLFSPPASFYGRRPEVKRQDKRPPLMTSYWSLKPKQSGAGILGHMKVGCKNCRFIGRAVKPRPLMFPVRDVSRAGGQMSARNALPGKEASPKASTAEAANVCFCCLHTSDFVVSLSCFHNGSGPLCRTPLWPPTSSS